MESLYYEFELKVQRIYLELDSACDVQIWWKHNKRKGTSKRYRINERVQYVELNETLRSTIKIRFVDGRPNPFKTDIAVLLYPLNSSTCKNGGTISNLDLTSILLPDSKKASVSNRYETKLQSSLPNSKIVFTLSSRFAREAGNEESMNDISFQGVSQSHFNNSQTDMTFRPPLNTEERNRKTSRNKEVASILRTTELEEKIESPLQRIDYAKMENNENEFVKSDKPLGFSFGPVGNPERERQNKALLDEVNQLRDELSNQKRENDRLLAQLRAKEAERNSGVDDKKLILLNQLNAAVNQSDQFKRERDEAISQLNKLKDDFRKLRDEVKEKQMLYGKAKDENRELAFNFNKLRDELSECSQKSESKRRQLEEVRPKLQKLQRQNQQMRNQLFRKQSELISNENQLENAKLQCANATKNQPILEELKRVNQDLGRQRAELERANNEKTAALEKEQALREELTKKLMGAKEEFEGMKGKFIESYKHQEDEFQFQIREIETEMHHLMMERQTLQENHAAQIEQLTIKNQELLKRLEEESNNNSHNASQEIESLKIQISELKVKVKHHEEIYNNLEKDYNQKEKQVIAKSEFIQKVREYVVKIEGENREKDSAIRERDEFIAKAKEFITGKEAEMLTEVEKWKKQAFACKERAEASQKLRNDISFLSNQNKEKEKFMGDIVRETNEKQFRIEELESQNQEMHLILTEMERRIEEMQGYIEMQNERFETNMDEVEELNRKIKSQQETLEDLVKKNLDMQIEINLKNFELRNIKGR